MHEVLDGSNQEKQKLEALVSKLNHEKDELTTKTRNLMQQNEKLTEENQVYEETVTELLEALEQAGG